MQRSMIKFKIEEGVDLPAYQTVGSAGMDVIAHSIIKAYKGDEEVSSDKLEKMKKGFQDRGYIKIRPFERVLFSTGITLAEMDNNLEIQVRSRSGMALKKGLLVANQPGTVDADYRGVIGVILYNSSPFLTEVKKGERIAQFVVNQVSKSTIQLVSDVVETERGDGGFGSTGSGTEDLV